MGTSKGLGQLDDEPGPRGHVAVLTSADLAGAAGDRADYTDVVARIPDSVLETIEA